VAVIKGTKAADRLLGTSEADEIWGYEGNDILDGRNPAGTAETSTTGDLLIGGIGNDRYYVDSSFDRIQELSGEGSDIVYSTGSYRLAGGVAVETLRAARTAGTDAIDLTGNEFAQTLLGNYGNNVLRGGGGNDVLSAFAGDDTLNGGRGADRMIGGAGNDRYVVDDASDAVVENAGEGVDTVLSSIDVYQLGDNLENLTLVGSATAGLGNSSSNIVTGNAGDNNLGGDGGSDTLTGGAGRDVFAFSTPWDEGPGVDVITDFNVEDDSFGLYGLVFTGFGRNGIIDEAAFHSGTAAHDADDRIIYDSATGNVYFDPDGTGDADAILFATVTPGTALTNIDFIVGGYNI
jgi:Ca2+-binding RTX toxin-like protein